MELKNLPNKMKVLFIKYRYALLILLIGIVLMCIPGKKAPKEEVVQLKEETVSVDRQLEEILSTIENVGHVRVLLTVAKGEETQYQTDSALTSDGERNDTKVDTVIVTDAQRNQYGLIRKVVPPVYQGALIVCSGADKPGVRLAVVNAVAKVTGLGADKISVLKMK